MVVGPCGSVKCCYHPTNHSILDLWIQDLLSGQNPSHPWPWECWGNSSLSKQIHGQVNLIVKNILNRQANRVWYEWWWEFNKQNAVLFGKISTNSQCSQDLKGSKTWRDQSSSIKTISILFAGGIGINFNSSLSGGYRERDSLIEADNLFHSFYFLSLVENTYPLQ